MLAELRAECENIEQAILTPTAARGLTWQTTWKTPRIDYLRQSTRPGTCYRKKARLSMEDHVKRHSPDNWRKS